MLLFESWLEYDTKSYFFSRFAVPQIFPEGALVDCTIGATSSLSALFGRSVAEFSFNAVSAPLDTRFFASFSVVRFSPFSVFSPITSAAHLHFCLRTPSIYRWHGHRR